MGVSTAVVGASGYTGAELLRLMAAHPDLELTRVTGDASAGRFLGDLHPTLAAVWPDVVVEGTDADALAGTDLVLLAMPHGRAQNLAPALIGRVGALVDLSADFRLRDPSLYPRWYGEPHVHPELLGEFAFGLPELFRSEVAAARSVAAPGCYVTAAALALAPLVRDGWIEPHGVIVDAASGVSGAGRPPKESTTFCTVDGDFRAYGLLDHRHTPEMEQAIGASILFTPHLAPMSRGILVTAYARPARPADTESVLAALRQVYDTEPFVVVGPGSPSTKATLGSNCAHLSARVDGRTGWVVVLCALDNLVKGASGQALQCANLVLGLPETTGLPRAGLSP